MTHKVTFPFLAAALLAFPMASTAESAPAHVLGVVESTGGYELVQGSTTRVVSPSQSRLARVSSGDRIIANSDSALVRLTDGNAVLIGSESTVEMVDVQTVRLDEGAVALAFVSGSEVSVQFDTIEVASVETRGEDRIVPMSGAQSGMIGLQQLGADRFRLTSLNQSAFVSNIGDATNFAVVNANETMDFVRNQAGQWLPAGNPFSVQGPTGEGTAEGDDEDRRRGAWILPVAGGVIAAGAIGYGIYYWGFRDDSSGSSGGGGGVVSPPFPTPPILEFD